ncbi:nitrous oxidase accessory protein [Zhouia amylolytica]|uniref:Nitrous oxidase accessory protein n=1 Tax=Zhouia amylolytica TaxID=376730 RepID=A0A1I6VER5_9FLAO|nr:nitrous oxide reductase family maturation protein NosD [Zhouia amylolytica]MCQ0110330.1 nitrous oxide reductase family maturation protein NosD [Zhouia amylolytica]SFT12206.1 nitrous oxidase accessory protein [Zhouia amylolytica]
MKHHTIISLFALIFFSVGNGQTINVCKDCPISDLAIAIELAQNNDTIVVSNDITTNKPIRINKNLTLIGNEYPIMDGMNEHEILTVQTDSFTIKGFKFQNVGQSFTKDHAAIRLIKSKKFKIESNQFENVYYGIFLEKCSKGLIKNNIIKGNATVEYKSGNGIHLWHCNNITIDNNKVSNVRDGIYFEFVDHSNVINNSSHDNLRYGLHFMFSNEDRYENNIFERNGAGVAVMFSKKISMHENKFLKNWGTASYGLLLKEIYDAEITRNTFEKNTIGINAEGSNRIEYLGNNFIENGWAVKILGACFDNNFTKNNFLNNTFDVAYSGRLNNNSFENNYWGEYSGYDLDKNGIGDVPHRPVKLFSYIVNQSPESIILLRSLMIDVLNFSEKVSPIFTPTDLYDSKPLMKKAL